MSLRPSTYSSCFRLPSGHCSSLLLRILLHFRIKSLLGGERAELAVATMADHREFYGSQENDEDDGEVYLDSGDVIEEVLIDEEDLPDVDEIVDGEENQIVSTDHDFFLNEVEVDDSAHIFTGHSDALYSVCCNPTDATLVATGGGDEKAFIWKIGQIDSCFELKGHSDSVVALAFSNDGRLLASGGLDGVIRIWDALTGSLKQTLEGPGGGIEWVRWHPKGHVVLAGSEDYTTWMWNADTGNFLSLLSGHSGSVTCGDFTPDGKTICTGSADGSLHVWNPKSGESVHIVKGHPYHAEGLTCLSISSDSTVVVSGSTDSTVHVVNIRTGKVIGSLVGHSSSIECVGFSLGMPWVATGGMDGKLIIWDLHSFSPRCTCQHEEGVIRLSWSSSSQYLITGCLDGKVRVWDSRSGSCERTFQGHEDSIRDMAVSVDRQFILTGADDQTARVFELGPL